MIDVALAKAKGRSACGLEGHCDSEEEAESIKNFIKDLLDEYADNGQVPTGDDIIKRLQQELNMDPAFANELVNVSLSRCSLRPLFFSIIVMIDSDHTTCLFFTHALRSRIRRFKSFSRDSC